MTENECCICMNEISKDQNDDIFLLECCNNKIHNSCLISWIKTSIETNNSDYNKCILCKKNNDIIEDYYNNIKYAVHNITNNHINYANNYISYSNNNDISSNTANNNNNDVIILINNNETRNKRCIHNFIYLLCNITFLFGLIFLINN